MKIFNISNDKFIDDNKEQMNQFFEYFNTKKSDISYYYVNTDGSCPKNLEEVISENKMNIVVEKSDIEEFEKNLVIYHAIDRFRFTMQENNSNYVRKYEIKNKSALYTFDFDDSFQIIFKKRFFLFLNKNRTILEVDNARDLRLLYEKN
jgi:hypothetical protein